MVEKERLLHKSRDLPWRPRCEFCPGVQVAGFPKSATFNNLTLTHSLNSPLGRGEDGLGRHFAPPPLLLFCLVLLSYLTSGVFSGCKLSLLKQHIFLILTQPSWDGYLLLYSPKSSFRSIISIYCVRNIYLGLPTSLWSEGCFMGGAGPATTPTVPIYSVLGTIFCIIHVCHIL